MKSLIQQITRIGVVSVAIGLTCISPASAQANDRLTPIQQRIQLQQRRLSSSSVEERRDALMKLGAMNHPDAARVAMSALNDSEPVVRVTAVHAMASLPASDTVAALTPLLTDKLEFVRREAANALGVTHSRAAVQPLIQLLTTDKEASVRAAAAVALGKIRDEATVVPLVNVLTGTAAGKKSKTGENEFVMRAAAESLGQIGSRAAVPTLIATLGNQEMPTDVRRSAAIALGAIGDATAVPSLQAALGAEDPFLSEAANLALRQITRNKSQ
jgi:HEAT repeat protein